MFVFYNPETSTNSCQLVPEEADCSVVLLLQQYGLVLVNTCELEFFFNILWPLVFVIFKWHLSGASQSVYLCIKYTVLQEHHRKFTVAWTEGLRAQQSLDCG